MRFLKISQNLPYLNKIGVPEEHAQGILEYLQSLEGDERKTAIRTIRKKPEMTLQELQSVSSGKAAYLAKQGYPQDTIDYAMKLSEKYAVWVARELTRLKDPNTAFTLSGDKFKEIIDWANKHNPDIMKMNVLEAHHASEAWHLELANAEQVSEYVTHNVIFTFEDGWEIVHLSSGDCEAEGEKMGHCVGSYADDVRNGYTEIYSLRDPQNNPHVSIEGGSLEASSVTISQVRGKQNDDPIDKYKAYVKAWFDALKADGKIFEPFENDNHYYLADMLTYGIKEVLGAEGYGIPSFIPELGGGSGEYLEAIEAAEKESVSRSGEWYDSDATTRLLEKIVEYAEHMVKNFNDERELRWLEEAIGLYQDSVYERSDELTENHMQNWYDHNYISEPEPEEHNFIDEEDVFDEEAYYAAKSEYDEALLSFNQARDSEQESIVNDFYPLDYLIFLNKQLEAAKERLKMTDNITEEGELVEANHENFIIKTAINYDDIPDPNQLAVYVESLKLYLDQGQITDKSLKHVVKQLPAPNQIKKTFSREEGIVLFQSIQYAWKEITGQDIIEEGKIENTKEKLEGNYWMLNNGILLNGPNHYTIIRDNSTLFCTLLDISGFAMHEQLASKPHKIIKTVLDHGGMRIFINKEQKSYFQLAADTYGKWGLKKIRKLDLKDAVVKVIDKSRPFSGWDSGITIKL